MKEIFVRRPYNYDMGEASRQSGLSCPEPTKTDQSFKEEVDILTIVKRFGLTGQLPQAIKLPTYGDFTGIFDFQSAQNAIRAAQESFMALPYELRARFHNDPQELLEFMEKEENRPEAEKLGLVQKRETPQNGVPATGTVTSSEPTVPATPKTGEKGKESNG